MILLLMLMFQERNMQFVSIARDKMPMEESDKEPCQDLGGVLIKCATKGKGTQNCIEKVEKKHRTWDSCQTECQSQQDLESPCVFYVFQSLVKL
jgi:Ribonuclease G/E